MTPPPYQMGIPEDEDDWEEEASPDPSPVELLRLAACRFLIVVVVALFAVWLVSKILEVEP